MSLNLQHTSSEVISSIVCEYKIQTTIAFAFLVTAIAAVSTTLTLDDLDTNKDQELSLSEYCGGASIFLLYFTLLNLFLYKIVRAVSIYIIETKRETDPGERERHQSTKCKGFQDIYTLQILHYLFTNISYVLGSFVLYILFSYVFQNDALDVLDQDHDGDFDKQDLHSLIDFDGDNKIETEEILVSVAVVGGGSIGILAAAELLLVGTFVWIYFLYVHKTRRDDAKRISDTAIANVAKAKEKAILAKKQEDERIRKVQEEEARIAEQEDERIRKVQEEEARIAAELEAKRIEDERIAAELEAKRIEDERIAESERKKRKAVERARQEAAEKAANEAKNAEIKAQKEKEEQIRRDEVKKEEERIAAELEAKQMEDAKIAAELKAKQMEDARIAEEKRIQREKDELAAKQAAIEAAKQAETTYKKQALEAARFDAESDRASINWRKELTFDPIPDATKNKYKAEIEQLTNAGYVYAKYIHSGSNAAIYQAKYTIPSRSITILGTEFPFGRQEIDVAVKVEKRNDGNVGDIEHEGKVLAGMWNLPDSQKYTVQYYGACGFSLNKDGSKTSSTQCHTLKLWGFDKEGKIHETEGQGLIMEFCPNGNLEVMHEKHTLTPENKLSIVKHFANGMLYLHKLGFIHQDLKPANIMTVFNEGRVVPKIMDYGGGSTTNQPFRGSLATSAYQPPELKKFGDNKDKGIVDIITEKFKKIDVFQFGVIANEIYMSSNGANFDNWLKNAQLEDPSGWEKLKDLYDCPFKKEWIDKLFHKFKTKLNMTHVYKYHSSSDEEVGHANMLPPILSTPMKKWVAIHHYLHRPGQAEMTAKIPLKDGETMKELICACWSLDPDDRPTFPNIVDRLQ